MAPPRPTPALLRFLLLALGTVAVGTVVYATLGVRGAGRTMEVSSLALVDMWVRWDAGWYEQIALRGYTYSASQQSAAAFFPLYPLSLRPLVSLGVNVFVAGEVMTFLFGAAAVVVFSRWAAALRPEHASAATWLLVLWPFAFYLVGAVYSDALYLLLIISAFLALERGKVGWATVLGALATATRPIAPAVVVGLLARQLELRRRSGQPLRPVDFMPVLSVSGLLAFMGFLWWRFGDPLGFATTQVGWQQLSGPAAILKYDALAKMKGVDLLFPLFHALLASGALLSAWPMRRTLGWGYAAYVGVAIGMPLISSRDFIGLGRYCLAVFPFFLQAAVTLDSRPRARRAWLLVSGAALVLMTARFAQGFYTS